MSDSERTSEEPSAQETPPERPAPKKAAPKSMFRDPVVRVMAWIAAGLVVLYLAGIVGALFFGVIGNNTPRTATERTIADLEAAIQSGDRTTETWSRYIYTLAAAQRYGDAQRAIDNAKRVVDQKAGAEITLAQGDIYFQQKDYKRALSTADQAMQDIQKYYDAQLKSTQEPNPAKTFGINDNYYLAALLKARAYAALGDTDNALKFYGVFLTKNAMSSDVFIERGQLKVKLGDTAGARADFEAALKYDPTNADALAALKKIGAK